MLKIKYLTFTHFINQKRGEAASHKKPKEKIEMIQKPLY